MTASSRLAGIPLGHVAAEIAAFPFASAAALELCPIQLDPSLDSGVTPALWRRAEMALLGSFPAFSVDEIVGLRDRLWFQERNPRPLPLHTLLRRLARDSLKEQGPVARPELPPAEYGDVEDPNVRGALSRRAWRWLSLAMPADLLLGALGTAERGPSRVDAITSVLDTHLRDAGFAETHLHIGAALDFELLWAAAMRGIASWNTNYAAFRSPGAELGEGIEIPHWLIRAALARLLLAGYLKRPRTNLLAWIHGPLRRAVTKHGGPCGFSMLLAALAEVERGRLDLTPECRFAALQGLYAVLSGVNAAPRHLRADPQTIDPLAMALTGRPGWPPRTPEVQLIATALHYLEGCEREGRCDPHFTIVFWQLVRIRSLFYRHVVHRPLTPGLQWFVRFYDRGRAARRALGAPALLESARRICGGDLGLRSLEIRTAPDENRSEQQRYVQAICDAAASWADGRVPFGRCFQTLGDEPGRSDDADRQGRADTQRSLEVGLVLHFIKDRGGGTMKGCPPAHWHDCHANPERNHSGYRYARYYLDRRRGAMAVEWLLRHCPLSLLVLRGFDVCTDEVGIPSWVLAPLLQRVRRAAEEGARALDSWFGWSPPPIHMTAHAGEDFVHLLTGLRLLDEAVEVFDLGCGDRIGHGLSLGIDPVDWASRAGMVPVAREDRLFDLVWERQFYALQGQCSDPARLSRLDREIRRPCDIIFGRGCNGAYDAGDIEYLWEDLRNPWALYSLGFPDDRPSVCGLHGCLDWPGDVDRRMQLLHTYLSNPTVFQRGRELVWVETAPEAHALAGVQAQLRGKIGARGITIEVNPTSNLLIGDLNDLTRHPLWRLRPIRDSDGDSPPVPICVGSDDPLVFNSNLRLEYQNLCDAMILAGYSEEEIRRWIDRTRKSGMESRFTIASKTASITSWYAPTGARPTLPI